ncbi:MAG: SUMF1/EgtB/PvdO family nonheme iron enzyme [Parachlamydiaceae bacterium]|nr:SUMF1/EgtB/PvdO family nonheme iron enzyme [Parachlamydiaceae bacterium]
METRILGDYNLIKQIGQGALGAAFLAEHRFMKKQYILKILPEELSSDRGFIQRFEDEIGLLATLDHPNIVKIHNISFAQAQYFLVMDCVVDDLGETTSLAQYMLSRTTHLEEKTLFHLLGQVADALDYAHNKKNNGKGIVHRNLKLNNILIAKGKEEIDIVISDFGLSRVIGTSAVLTRTYKMVAEALGFASVLYASTKSGLERYPNPAIEPQKQTPLHASFLQNIAFLAPEQRRTDHQYPVDLKADVFAFGVLAYYLLSGEFPEGYFEMPSAKREDFNWNWDGLVTSCLHADPSKRPESLTETLNAIRFHPNVLKTARVVEPVDENSNKVMEIFESGILQQTYQAVKPRLEPLSEVKLEGIFSADKEHIETVNEERAPEYSALLEDTTAIAHSGEMILHAGGILRPVLRTTQLDRPRTDHDPAAAFQIDASVKHYVPERKEIKNIQPLLTEMVVISGGTFNRGSKDGNRDEMPRHQITLDSFAIDIHPTTNEQFVRFLEVMGGEKDSNHQDIIRMRDSRIKRTGGKLSIESGYSKHPVVGVTWYGAIAYAMWVGKRLPTEAEWEVAARGGLENVLYPSGEDIEKNQANFFSADTTAVMSYVPNNYGLYDIAGNVYEWCHDWYGYNYYEVSVQEPENPQGPVQGVYRVLRGGCWKSLKEDLRCSRRHRNNPGTVNGTYGFRCAADVQ